MSFSSFLKPVPQLLGGYFVVELHFCGFYYVAQLFRAAVCHGLLAGNVLFISVRAHNFFHNAALSEKPYRILQGGGEHFYIFRLCV